MFKDLARTRKTAGDKGNDLFDVANRRSILEVALEYGAQLTPESGRTEFSGPCLKCGGKDRLHVSVAKNGWFCRNCYPLEKKGWKDVIDFVAYFGNTTVSDAIRRLTGQELRATNRPRETASRPTIITRPLSGVEGSRNVENDNFDPTYYESKLKASQAVLAGSDGKETSRGSETSQRPRETAPTPAIVTRPQSGVEGSRNADSNDFDPVYYESKLKASQAALAGSDGEVYLRGRGLTLETARRFGIGFDPSVAVPGTNGAQRAPAIAIPWTSGGKLSGVRYRFLATQTNPEGKQYKQSGRGSFRGLLWGGAGLLGVAHFPGRPIESLRTLVICEGEINAMSIWQAAHLSNLDVMSIGSQDSKFTAPMIAFVHRYGRVLVWMDEPDRAARVCNDLAGARLIAGVASPEKKDANDWLQSGVLDFILAYYRIKRLSGGDAEEIKRVIFDHCDLLDRGGELCAETHKFLSEYAEKVGVEYGRAK